MVDASAVTALLGPTNTGKTHRAIERMLEHPSGMIGLPLRLLAREVYDKVSARLGEERVALVTGEEQRVPRRPAYWVATVEAMPVDHEVDFIATDEVQLATHRQRGHVFTSRILHARGRRETWLLGAGTMEPILAELAPTARVEQNPRLSRLSFAGSTPLARLPPRSAVVAFSVPHAYELAERLRVRRGGAAIVLGALSPRTRNAQVAMFQAGEVDYLVATDAIGMGLNLDVGHVAFAALRKFDGDSVREVEADELAQIAGRAGRWIQDGTFGTLDPLDLPLATARSIEQSHFPRVRRVRWRNEDLDFTSLASLAAALAVPPPRPLFLAAPDAEDRVALNLLARREDIARLAVGPERVRLLWEVCTIPDFRKLLSEVHADLLATVFLALVHEERLTDDFLRRELRGLDDTSGDVEVLVGRLAAIRTWSYVANRSLWLESPTEWQAATRALEDGLSDALHARLVLRFVDVRKTQRQNRPRPRVVPSRGPDLLASPAPGHPFASLARLRQQALPTGPVLPATHGDAWVHDVVEASHAAFRLDPGGLVHHVASHRTVAELVGGVTVALPDVRLIVHEELGAGSRSRLQRRLLAYARDVVTHVTGELATLRDGRGSAPLRGLVHRLEQGLGTALTRDLEDLLQALDAPERQELERAGVHVGKVVVYLPSGLRGDVLLARAALAAAYFGVRTGLEVPSGGSVSRLPKRGIPDDAYRATGFPVFGPRAIRADVAERVAGTLREPDVELPPDTVLAGWLGCSVREVARVVAAFEGRPEKGGDAPGGEDS